MTKCNSQMWPKFLYWLFVLDSWELDGLQLQQKKLKHNVLICQPVLSHYQHTASSWNETRIHLTKLWGGLNKALNILRYSPFSAMQSMLDLPVTASRLSAFWQHWTQCQHSAHDILPSTFSHYHGISSELYATSHIRLGTFPNSFRIQCKIH